MRNLRMRVPARARGLEVTMSTWQRRGPNLETAQRLCSAVYGPAILRAKHWLIRHPVAFYLIAPFSFRPISQRKRDLQMAWIGLNARLLAIGVANFSRHLVLKNGRVFVRTRDGILVEYDFKRRDGGLHPMYIYDFVYESRELEVIRRYLRPHSTFVDIGANIGMHSIRANEEGLSDCSVLAIEADQATFRSLEANVGANSKAGKIKMHHAALWSSVTPIEWHGDQLEHGHNHASAASVKTGRTIVSETLDAILAKFPDTRSISVIKIDVEGAELEVLKGAERTLRLKKPALVIEIDDAHLAKNGSNGDKIRSYLRSLGYQREVPIVNALSRKADNFLFLP